MKKSGLSYRFKDSDRQIWLNIDWYACLVCRCNQWDALHHIISPSSRLHVAGEHNSSIFNSCPIHNIMHPYGMRSCHVGNEAFLYRDETIKKLLNETFYILINEAEYIPKSNDLIFLKTYISLYTPENAKIITTLL